MLPLDKQAALERVLTVALNKAVDFANYTATPSPQQTACLLSDGYSTAIVGVSFGTIARQQLVACVTGGMEVEAFCWIRFNDDWRYPLDKALAAIEGLPVTRLWLDCEDATTWPEQAIANRIHEAQAYIAARRPDLNSKAIYTGGWWWNRYMPTNQEFASWDLWTANYVNNPASPPSGQPPLYGGWTKAAIWQYAGSIETCGLNTDRNTILEDGLSQQDVDKINAHTTAEANRVIVYMYGRFISLIDWMNKNIVAKLGK